MSEQRRSSAGGKVTILNSGEPALSQQVAAQATEAAAAATTSGTSGSARNSSSRRKVATNLERSFVDPGAGSSRQAQQSQQQQQQRPVLKAGKAVASAPTPLQPRPLTELEKAFAERSVQDQRWLLSFPLALKQLYFSFAESTNHEQTLTVLINRFPELLAGNEQHPSAIQLAIERANWTPAKQFIGACVKGGETYIRLLTQRCSGPESQTFLIQAVQRAGQDDIADVGPAKEVILILAKECPELLATADLSGRNPMHYFAEQPKLYTSLLLPLLAELRQLASDSPNLARRLGNALAAADNKGNRPIDLLQPTVANEATTVRDTLQKLMSELPVGPDDEPADDPMLPPLPAPVEPLAGEAARKAICSALAQRRKAADFVSLLSERLGDADPRIFLLGTVERPEQVALDWFASTNADDVRQVLTIVGLPEFCDLVDRL